MTEEISWRHTIELGHGATAGKYHCEPDLEQARVPADLTGQTVLDIGCSDGGHTFLCEGRGASVVGIDSGESPRNEGRNGFEIARDSLGSNAEYHRSTLAEFAATTDRTFDHVLCFNVLYHVVDPMGTVIDLVKLTTPGGTAYLKSLVHSRIPSRLQSILPPDWRLTASPELTFVEDSYDGDPTCWWIPNPSAMVALMRRAGFENVEATARDRNRLFVRGVRPLGASRS